MQDFASFLNNVSESKKQAHNRAWFNLIQVAEGDPSISKDQIDVSKYIIDREEGKPAQKQIHAGDKDNPVMFMPSEIMDKYNVKETQEVKPEVKPQDNGTNTQPEANSPGQPQI